MSPSILRRLLGAFAAILVLNLLLFNYSRHVLLPLAAAALLLLLLIGLGAELAVRLRVGEVGVAEAAALGLMAACAYFFLLCFFAILNPVTIGGFFAICLLATARRFFAAGSGSLSRGDLAKFVARSPGEYALFLLPLVYAALPPTFYDSLVYHLGIPNLYLQSGGFVATPQFVYANTFIYYEISLIPALYLGDLVPRLFHFLLGVVLVLTVADEAVADWGVKRRLTVIVALASLPMTLFLLATCKNDLPGALLVFLAITRFRRGGWKLSAAFWGFAIGIKYFNLLLLLPFLLVAFRPWRKGELRRLALFGIIVLLAVSPLLVKNGRFTGNPVFPFMNGLFPSPAWDASRSALMSLDVGRMADSLADALRLPYDLSFFVHGFGGLIGPVFLAFLPFLLLGPVAEKRWLAWALLVLLLTPFFTASLRFAYAAFAVLAPYVALVLERTASKLLRTLFAVLVAMSCIMGAALLETNYQGRLLWGGELSPQEYRARHFPAYPVFRHLNSLAPRDAKILLLGEARNLYLNRCYEVSSALDYSLARRYLSASRDAGEFAAALRADGFTHVVMNFSELERLQQRYAVLQPAEKEKLLGFLGSLKPSFQSGASAVYDLADAGHAGAGN